MILRRPIALVCLFLLAATSAAQATAAPSGMSLDAAFYLNVALNIMQRSSINKDKIDWTALRAAALERAAGARTYADTYPAIEFSLKGLGDRHSFFLPPAVAAGQDATPAPGPPDSGRIVAERFGYLYVRNWSGTDPAAHAARLQRIVQSVEKNSPCAWIVDLRNGTGGDLFPMLAGLGPVLGDGVAAKIVYPSGQYSEVFYITTSVMADRTGQRYGGVVQPDIAVDGPDEPSSGVDDTIIQAAARWLTIQPSCARAMASRIP